MSARVCPATTPSRSATGRSATEPAQTRLPWWAVALPAVAFCALLALLVTGGDAEAAGTDGGPGPAALLESIGRVLPL